MVSSAFAVGLAGCTFGLDFEECKENAECDEGLICSEEGYCVTAVSLYEGAAYISPELEDGSRVCGAVHGPASEDGVIVIGTILPTSGPSAELGVAIEQAVVMAVDDFNDRGGLGPDARPFAVVLCDSRGEPDRGATAVKHLASLGVPAAVGPAFSGVMLEVGTKFVQPGSEGNPDGLVVVSPSSTSTSITNLGDRVWRTTPSDALQAKAMSEMLVHRAAWGLPLEDSNPKTESNVVVIYKKGPYGFDLQFDLVEALGANADEVKKPFAIEYPDPSDYEGAETEWFNEPYAQVLKKEPEVIVLIGTQEATDILAFLEEAWLKVMVTGRGKAPLQWIVSEGGKLPELFDAITQKADDLQKEFCDEKCKGECESLRREKGEDAVLACLTLCPSPDCPSGPDEVPMDPDEVLARIKGTVPGSPQGAVFDVFENRMITRFGYEEAPVYSAQAFDATYAIAYAIGAALGKGADPVRSNDVVVGLGRLGAGSPVDVSPSQISSGMSLLSDSAEITIDLQGASGTLDFNVDGEPAVGPIDVWTPELSSRTFATQPIIDADGQLVVTE